MKTLPFTTPFCCYILTNLFIFITMKNKRKKPEIFQRMGLTRLNLQIFVGGIICIVLGYISLAIGKTNDIWSLSIGPILLVLGYVVLLPLALAYRHKSELPEK